MRVPLTACIAMNFSFERSLWVCQTLWHCFLFVCVCECVCVSVCLCEGECEPEKHPVTADVYYGVRLMSHTTIDFFKPRQKENFLH